MELTAVQGSIQLATPTARAWLDLEAACLDEFGVDLDITSPAGGYRSPEMVLDMWLSSPARRRLVYGVPLGVSVARPTSLGGSGSVHENGRCVDINNWGELGSTRLDALAKRFGFARDPRLPKEPWHYEHAGGGSGGGIQTPAPATSIEENNVNGIIYYVGKNSKGATLDADMASRTTPIQVALPGGGSHAVGPLSMYFQDHPGAPLVAFTGGQAYSKTVNGIEYLAFKEARSPYTSASQVRLDVTITDMAALVDLRGLVA